MKVKGGEDQVVGANGDRGGGNVVANDRSTGFICFEGECICGMGRGMDGEGVGRDVVTDEGKIEVADETIPDADHGGMIKRCEERAAKVRKR